MSGRAAATAAMTGTTRRDLLGRIDRRVAGSGRLAPDVEQVGALGDHPARGRHGPLDGIGALEEPVARERVRRDVEDAHDVGAPAPVEDGRGRSGSGRGRAGRPSGPAVIERGLQDRGRAGPGRRRDGRGRRPQDRASRRRPSSRAWPWPHRRPRAGRVPRSRWRDPARRRQRSASSAAGIARGASTLVAITAAPRSAVPPPRAPPRRHRRPCRPWTPRPASAARAARCGRRSSSACASAAAPAGLCAPSSTTPRPSPRSSSSRRPGQTAVA